MSIMGLNGFEYGFNVNFEDDGLIVTGGGVGEQNFGTPAGSASTVRAIFLNMLGPCHQPWVSGEQAGGTPNTASGTVYWWHMYLQWSNFNTLGYAGSGIGVTEGVTLSTGAGGTVQLRVGGLDRGAESAAVLSLSAWHRFHVKIDHQTGGDVEVYLDGDLTTPIITYTLIAADITNLTGKGSGFWWQADGVTAVYCDDCFSLDPADAIGVTDIELLANASVQGISITGNGNYQQWNGDYTDIDEIPASDVDYIDVASIDQAATYAVENASQAAVHFVQSKWRMTRTGSSAGVQAQVRIRNGATDKDETITAAPGSGNIIQHHHTAPDGSAWNKTKFDASEFGMVSRT